MFKEDATKYSYREDAEGETVTQTFWERVNTSNFLQDL